MVKIKQGSRFLLICFIGDGVECLSDCDRERWTSTCVLNSFLHQILVINMFCVLCDIIQSTINMFSLPSKRVCSGGSK